MKAIHLIFCLALCGLSSRSFSAENPSSEDLVFLAKYSDDNGGNRELLFSGYEPGNLGREAIGEIRYPRTLIEHETLGKEWIIEVRGRNREIVERLLLARDVVLTTTPEGSSAPDEIFTLVESGPSANRIDLVFMGDGYTAEEKEKFLSDMKRMTKDLFSGNTFRSYLPLFNVYAVFRPSKESGIGKNDTPKNTAYGLYRQGNTLRAIFLSNRTAANQSCRMAPGCDYPIVIGNDPYYGGLGGEFAISTSSPTSGTMVLRHELGHNFGRVGEEYDGGGYFGANYSNTIANLSWRHWTTEKDFKAEPGFARTLGWPWHPLSKGPYQGNFVSDGRAKISHLDFSLSGLDSDNDIVMRLDGRDIPLKSPGYSDRAFHDVFFNEGFSAGNHQLVFEEKVKDGNNWLSNLKVYEYGTGYHFEKTYVGAFPVFSKEGMVEGYRSTHDRCLMRDMKSDRFCPICQENNWQKFLSRVNLVDNVKVEGSGDNITVSVVTPQLAQFKANPNPDEKLLVRWYLNGKEVTDLSGVFSWTKSKAGFTGNWDVLVSFTTPEVRKDTPLLLTTKRKFVI